MGFSNYSKPMTREMMMRLACFKRCVKHVISAQRERELNWKFVATYSEACRFDVTFCALRCVYGSVYSTTLAVAYGQRAAWLLMDRVHVWSFQYLAILWACVRVFAGACVRSRVCLRVSRLVMQWSWWRPLGSFHSRATRQIMMPTAANRWLSMFVCL